MEGAGKPRATRLKAADLTLQSGEVGEGKYRWWIEAEGGPRSPETKLAVDFDNAAPAAYIRLPADRASWEGGTVHLAGAAIVGATASVGGTPLTFDDHQRFESDLPRPSGETGIAVRISHPEHGVHYYLRRPARSP